MPRGMGHGPEMVKISPACVGHNQNLSPLENILLLLLFVEKVQRGASASRLASKGFFGENTNCLIRRIKYGYISQHFLLHVQEAPFWALTTFRQRF